MSVQNAVFTRESPFAAGAATAALYRRVAASLVPLLLLCYIVAMIDRLNVSYAKLQFMADLHFDEAVFGMAAGSLYVGYIPFEAPSNLMLERAGLGLTLLRIMSLWGAFAMAMAFAANRWGFYATRFMIGAAEAGFFPGVLFYLTLWFPSGWRTSLIFVAGAVGIAAIAWSSDRTRERRWHLMSCGIVASAALFLLPLAARSPNGASLCLTAASVTIFAFLALFWTAPTAVLGKGARAGGVALVSSIGASGSAVSPAFIGWAQVLTGSLFGAIAVLAFVFLSSMAALYVYAPAPPKASGRKAAAFRGPVLPVPGAEDASAVDAPIVAREEP